MLALDMETDSLNMPHYKIQFLPWRASCLIVHVCPAGHFFLDCGSGELPTSTATCEPGGSCVPCLNASALQTLGWRGGIVRSSSPSLRTFHAAVNIEHIMYVLGGQPIGASRTISDEVDLSLEESLVHSFLWSYDPQHFLWIPISIDFSAVADALRDVVGQNASYVIDLSAVPVHAFRDMPDLAVKYNARNLVLSFGGFTRSDFSDCTKGVLQNGLTVFTVSQRTVWAFAFFKRGNCSEVKSLHWPSPRRGQTAVLYNDLLVVFGGISYVYDGACNHNRTLQTLSEVWYLNVTTLAWSRLNSTGKWPEPRFGHSAISAGGKMWVFGGSSETGVLDRRESFWSFTFATQTWECLSCLSSAVVPSSRFYHAASQISESKFVISGGCVKRVEIFLNNLGCVYCSSRLILDKSTWVFSLHDGRGTWQQLEGRAAVYLS